MQSRGVASSTAALGGAVATCLVFLWCACALSSAVLNTEELVRASGYPSETHRVITGDGYVLTLHRLPPRHSCRNDSLLGPRPVLLQHGIFHSSADFVVMGPTHALGYILSDGGYDVWLANSRGNFYSRRHLNLSTSAPDYWNFSWHEMGKYDEPAMIDYILKETHHDDLFYVGHSMGAAIFFAMLHQWPELNSKIRLMFGLAPASYMHHGKSPISIPVFKYMHTSKLNGRS